MPPGRPRNHAHSDAARQAAFELLREHGYAAITMEAVADRTGISKQTLYRRWKHKRALILDAFAEQADLLPELPDTGTFSGDLQALLRATFATLRGECGVTNRALVTEALQDPEFLTELRERHLSRRRRQITTLLHRHAEQGALLTPPTDTLVDLILGPVWYRLLLHSGPMDDQAADELAGLLVRLAQPPSPPG
ncbi:TetR/AcrR family transcriptional regulator (plasmid) [Deinococcus taeanensis]|uniref:TetR/AcrR family transcriptional regulator n=1 Tax=Deinococcus taeanensis TaxID=2737050 RepID=UPI001CDD806B|nr:TetR/AcrR family transcriptional regulator [Deinococcus taeanensis]UBV44893.1 TetR/AcrR family transcriptional regulator [Deinococcus taeanensis]